MYWSEYEIPNYVVSWFAIWTRLDIQSLVWVPNHTHGLHTYIHTHTHISIIQQRPQQSNFSWVLIGFHDIYFNRSHVKMLILFIFPTQQSIFILTDVYEYFPSGFALLQILSSSFGLRNAYRNLYFRITNMYNATFERNQI